MWYSICTINDEPGKKRTQYTFLSTSPLGSLGFHGSVVIPNLISPSMWWALSARNASTVYLQPPWFLPRKEGLLLLVTSGGKPGKESSDFSSILILGSRKVRILFWFSVTSSSEGEFHMGDWWLLTGGYVCPILEYCFRNLIPLHLNHIHQPTFGSELGWGKGVYLRAPRISIGL